jgi:hypothetical protein
MYIPLETYLMVVWIVGGYCEGIVGEGICCCCNESETEFLGSGAQCATCTSSDVRANFSHKRKCGIAGENSNLFQVFRFITISIAGNEDSAPHIQYVMDNIVLHCPAKDVYIFAHWGSCREVVEYLNTTCTSSRLLTDIRRQNVGWETQGAWDGARDISDGRYYLRQVSRVPCPEGH